MDEVECTVCGEIHPIENLISHISLQHPQYLITLASFALPNASEADLLNWFYTFVLQGESLVEEEEQEDVDAYQYYTELCEMIGNHYVGVEDIEKVAPAMISEKLDTCPICFEKLCECLYSRKTVCAHSFCGPCLETWLEKHKTCPVCKADVTEVAAQMASISKSSEEDAEPTASSSRPSPSSPEGPSCSMNNT